MGSRRVDSSFWLRILGQAVVVSAPLAWTAASGRLGLGTALLLCALSGTATLLIWDGVRRRAGAAEGPTLVQTGEVRPAVGESSRSPRS